MFAYIVLTGAAQKNEIMLFSIIKDQNTL